MSLFGRSRAKSLTLVLPPAPTPAPTPATSLSCGRGRSPNPQGFGRHIRSPLASLEPSLTPTPDPEAHPEGQAISPANEKELSGTMDGSRKKRRRSQEGSENTDEWLRVLQPTLVLKNSGSVARDHLASERTFLAYVRTSIGISTVGIAIVQLLKISTTTTDSEEVQRFARPLGGTLIGLSILTLALGCWRYFTIQRMLVDGNFPATRVAITFLSVVVGAVTVVIFGVLVGIRSISS